MNRQTHIPMLLWKCYSLTRNLYFRIRLWPNLQTYTNLNRRNDFMLHAKLEQKVLRGLKGKNSID